MAGVDRIIELDVDAIGEPRDRADAKRLVDRLLPLWRDAQDTGGIAGIVLNLGWLLDPIVLFGGNPDETLPIQSRRLAKFSQLTYRELRETIDVIRDVAAERGIAHLRIGMLVLGIGEFVNEIVRPPGTGTDETAEGALYQEEGEWYRRHPELFPFDPAVTLHGPGLDWRVSMHADGHSYAARPEGIAEGESFSAFLAEQWRAIVDTIGFDLLLLRDESTTPVHAGRIAFDRSDRTATMGEVDEWSSAFIEAMRALKAQAPATWLMVYSSGLSPTVELRYGRLDIERVVRETTVDAWVDQTWGGAWQDWWDAGWQGWTFQLSNLLARAALIAEGNRTRQVPCRHYPLIQLLDGWEPYDTLHDYPNKLKWGIWAFLHATTHHQGGSRRAEGAYLAIANDRTATLINGDDVAWISDTVSSAQASASAVTRVLGPTLLMSSAASSVDASAASESAEDVVGFLQKWGVPTLSSMVADPKAAQSFEAVVVSAGSTSTWDVRGATLIAGAPDDLTNKETEACGVLVFPDSAPPGYRRGIAPRLDFGVKPYAWPYMGGRRQTAAHDSVVVYDGEDGPTLTRNRSTMWWVPPSVANGTDRRMTHYQVGTIDPHVLAAATLNQIQRATGLIAIAPVQRHLTVSMHAWVSNNTLMILLGNVESGWIGDSRFSRTVRLYIPQDLLRNLVEPVLIAEDDAHFTIADGASEVTVPSEGYLLLSLRDGHSTFN